MTSTNRTEYHKNWRQNNRERVNKYQSKWNRNNPERFMLRNVKARAKKNGIEFSLGLEDIHIPEFCPILGIELEGGKGRWAPSAPSLDRIDNTKGYVKGNVWVISSRANVMKNAATHEELKRFAQWINRL